MDSNDDYELVSLLEEMISPQTWAPTGPFSGPDDRDTGKSYEDAMNEFFAKEYGA